MDTLNYDDSELKQITMNDFVPFEDKIKSKKWYVDYIDNLDCKADIKNALKAILDITGKCGETILHIGKIAVHIAVSVAQKFPQTVAGAVLGLAITLLVNGIPWLGGFLASLLAPVIIAVPTFIGFLADVKSGSVQEVKATLKDILSAR